MPNISVIVPVYNAEKYLKRCVYSILNQTYQDFELILVDDGSNDQSGILCDQLAMEAQGIRIRVIHQKNAGQSAARNRAVEIAEGKWVTFIDSDDYVHPQLLEILYRGVTQHNVKISMCGAVFNASDNENNKLLFNSEKWTIEDVNESFFINLYNADWQQKTYKNEVIWGKMIAIEIPRKYPLTERRIYEDSAIMCRWFAETEKVAACDCKMYYYVDNPDGTMNAVFSAKKLDKLWSLEEMEKLFLEKGYHRMAERAQKLYCYIALAYEDQCNNGVLIAKIRKMRRKKLLRRIWSWSGSLKQKYSYFQEYYTLKKG